MIFTYLILAAMGIGLVTWLCSLDIVENFVETFIWVGIALILAGVCVPGYGAYRWLKTGEWASIPVHQALDWIGYLEPAVESTRWVGIDKLAVHYLESSAGLTLFFGGMYVVFCVNYWYEEGEKRRREKKAREEVLRTENLH